MFVHRWWYGPPMPAEYVRARQRWEDGGFEVVEWDPLPDGIRERVEAASGRVSDVRHASNVARWLLLAEYGGWWADCDLTPPRDPGRDLDGGLVVGWFGGRACSALVGGPAGHELWDRLAEASETAVGDYSPPLSGTNLLDRVALDYRPAKVPLVGRWTHQRATQRRL